MHRTGFGCRWGSNHELHLDWGKFIVSHAGSEVPISGDSHLFSK